MGPIKKILWKRKYKNKIDKCFHTTRFLQTLAQLRLWSPSAEREFILKSRVGLKKILKYMAVELGSENK